MGPQNWSNHPSNQFFFLEQNFFKCKENFTWFKNFFPSRDIFIRVENFFTSCFAMLLYIHVLEIIKDGKDGLKLKIRLKITLLTKSKFRIEKNGCLLSSIGSDLF